MVSKRENIAALISSVMDYMVHYKFQGVDLGWKYPGDTTRGGRKLADTRSFSLLLRQLRPACGTPKGFSLTLATDYQYLRWFDAKAIESSIDFFGFVAYDLHSSWDADVLALAWSG
jgi:chitinase